MAAINDDVYARVREKVKEHNLTEQEVKAIDTARDQLQTHTYTGGLAGASAAFFLGKAKKFNPIQLLALTGGGFLMGSQMGLISGALAGVKTINTLPNPQRLINVVREVQLEAMKGRQGALGPTNNSRQENAPSMRPHQMTPQELHEAQSPQDQFSPDINENISGGDGSWGNGHSSSGEMDVTDETDPLSRTQIQQNRNQPAQPSVWDKIRSENLPNNTWSRIRMEAQKNPDDVAEIAKSKAERTRKLMNNSELDGNGQELPRTREEALQKVGPTRKNQWGDALE